MARISENVTDIQVTLTNIKKNDYSVQDYKLCPKEADIVVKALEKYLEDTKFDENVRVM